MLKHHLAIIHELVAYVYQYKIFNNTEVYILCVNVAQNIFFALVRGCVAYNIYLVNVVPIFYFNQERSLESNRFAPRVGEGIFSLINNLGSS